MTVTNSKYPIAQVTAIPGAGPETRPEDAPQRLRIALGFNVVFAEEFKILRPYLVRISRGWSIKIQDMMTEHEDLKGKFSTADMMEFDRLMENYVRQMRTGRYYEDFFHSVDELAQFFIARQVQNSWLVGAFMNVFYDAQLEIFFEKEARQGRVVVAALRCLLKIMTLTIQILNRASFAQPATKIEELQRFG